MEVVNAHAVDDAQNVEDQAALDLGPDAVDQEPQEEDGPNKRLQFKSVKFLGYVQKLLHLNACLCPTRMFMCTLFQHLGAQWFRIVYRDCDCVMYNAHVGKVLAQPAASPFITVHRLFQDDSIPG
jgi:hypothetical protein